MIDISITRTISIGSIPSRIFIQAATMVLKDEKKSHAQIHFVFLNDASIKKINKKFLKHNFATDVITFPLESKPILESEIYISVETARRQAKEFHVSLTNELVRLVVHGLLHLCDYDDKNERDKMLMKKKENFYLDKHFSH